jgi:hypothetical protein
VICSFSGLSVAYISPVPEPAQCPRESEPPHPHPPKSTRRSNTPSADSSRASIDTSPGSSPQPNKQASTNTQPVDQTVFVGTHQSSGGGSGTIVDLNDRYRDTGERSGPTPRGTREVHPLIPTTPANEPNIDSSSNNLLQQASQSSLIRTLDTQSHKQSRGEGKVKQLEDISSPTPQPLSALNDGGISSGSYDIRSQSLLVANIPPVPASESQSLVNESISSLPQPAAPLPRNTRPSNISAGPNDITPPPNITPRKRPAGNFGLNRRAKFPRADQPQPTSPTQIQTGGARSVDEQARNNSQLADGRQGGGIEQQHRRGPQLGSLEQQGGHTSDLYQHRQQQPIQYQGTHLGGPTWQEAGDEAPPGDISYLQNALRSYPPPPNPHQQGQSPQTHPSPSHVETFQNAGPPFQSLGLPHLSIPPQWNAQRLHSVPRSKLQQVYPTQHLDQPLLSDTTRKSPPQGGQFFQVGNSTNAHPPLGHPPHQYLNWQDGRTCQAANPQVPQVSPPNLSVPQGNTSYSKS